MAIKIANNTVIDDSRSFLPQTISVGSTVGAAGSILSSTGTGLEWITPPSGGGSGTFDVGITSSLYAQVSAGVGTTFSTNNDIFIGPGVAYTFPNTAGKRYVIESINITNKFNNNVFFNAIIDYSGGPKTPVFSRIGVPYQATFEAIQKPIVLNPSDTIRFQCLSGINTTSIGISTALDSFITYSEKTDTTFVGIGTTVTSVGIASTQPNADQVIYTSSNKTVIESIYITNYNLFVDVDVSVSVYNSSSALKGYLIYNLTIPVNSTIQILEKPKQLNASESIRMTTSARNAISAILSGRTY